jgi:DNA-binding phage protein
MAMEVHLRRSKQPSRQFVDAVLTIARERGIDQATLAKEAGIAPEALSRLKKAGNCRLATALALAKAAGLTRLVLRPGPGSAEAALGNRSAAIVCARKLSAGRRTPINAEELVAALRGGMVPARHRAHVFGFFEELPIDAVHEVVLDEGLDFRHLARVARHLGAEGKTVEWIEDMAGDGVATAA